MAFNLGWWGFTFPLGVFALATFELQRQTGLAFFGAIGTLLALQLATVWALVMRRTLAGIWHGELFRAPCLCTLGPGAGLKTGEGASSTICHCPKPARWAK